MRVAGWRRYYWNATNNVDVLWDPPPGVRLEGTFLNAQIITEIIEMNA